jgi:PAS domain S-box-containing protein
MGGTVREEHPSDLTLSALLDNIEEGFVAYDRDWRIIYLNRAARRTLAAAAPSSEDVIGRVLWDAFPALIGTPLEASYRAARDGGEPVEFEELSPVSRRWFLFRAFPSGSGLSVLVTDITAKREAAEALRASEATLRSIFDHSPQGILLTAPSGEIFAANPAACRMLGRSEEELRAGGRSAVVDVRDPRLPTLLEERSRTGHCAGELMLMRGDGSTFPAELESAVFTDAHGALRTSMSFHDLTARKAAEAAREQALAALRASEERFRLVFDNAPIGMALITRDGRFVQVNERLCDILGRPPDDLLHHRLDEVTYPTEVERERRLATALDHGHIPRYELDTRYLHCSGAIVEARTSVSRLAASDDQDPLFIIEVQDITTQKRIEAQLTLSDRLVSIGTLAGGMAHEINNPLAIVMANLELIARRVRTLAAEVPASTVADLSSAIEDARTGADRVRAITHDLRSFAEAEREHIAPVDLRRVLQQVIRLTARGIQSRAELRTDYGPTPLINADEPRLTQALLDVLVNAGEAISRGAPGAHRVDVRTFTDDTGNAVVEIEDTGAGIPDEVLPRIFDPFFTTKEIGAGTGLGLSITHAIVTGLGGTIDVNSTPGRGTRVRISIPPRPSVETRDHSSTPGTASTRPSER